jgi:FixJ family two-component response regulator
MRRVVAGECRRPTRMGGRVARGLRLPVFMDPQLDDPDTNRAVSAPSANVVIIDDDGSVRKALRRLMRSVGFTVTTYVSAEEFLAAGGEPAPAFLVLDVRLPGMSGLDLQRLLADSGRDIAVVVITAHDDQAARRMALDAGAVDFIVKPFDRDRLLGAVAKVMARGA